MIINAGPRASNGKNSGDWSKPQDDNGDASAAWTSARVSENSQTEAVRRSAILHGRPEAYKAARSKLKLAVFEFYRYLGLLRSYKVVPIIHLRFSTATESPSFRSPKSF